MSRTFHEPGLFRGLCRGLMPTQSICDAVDVNVYTDAKIPDIILISRAGRQFLKKALRTGSMQFVRPKTPS